jgi:hypothetical protein
MEGVLIAILSTVGLIALYILVRLSSSAVFRSYFELKKKYEEEKKDGKI